MPVIEFEVGANRPDCLSIIGLAKEAAAATDAKFKAPDTSFSKGCRGYWEVCFRRGGG